MIFFVDKSFGIFIVGRPSFPKKKSVSLSLSHAHGRRNKKGKRKKKRKRPDGVKTRGVRRPVIIFFPALVIATGIATTAIIPPEKPGKTQ